ncbi:MAG TPA: FliH/SctL family protein [Candidatus Sulfotelmatobacter sp.]|nr:FliH/SctL family protein [Candidatus Sulfotelmatobacter sp.]HWI57552.1 FliH/SctL family protein [Bacillota bacterium]
MRWSKTIVLPHPLRDVRRLTGAPPQDWEALLRQREAAAYERGRREGEQALSQQLIQQRNEMAELQRGILESLRRAVPQVVQEAEGALIQLALEAAQRVVAGLPIDAELVEGIVREALRHVEDSAEITIQLHPEDLALLRNDNSPLLNGLPEAGPLRFVSSAEVTRGGCILQTRFGLIDARREVKLEQLAQSLSL